MSLLLQLTQATPDSLALQSMSSEETLTFLELLQKGGWWLVPLVLLQLAAVYIFFERIFTIKRADRDSDDLMDRVRHSVMAGDITGAKSICSGENTPIARMIEKGIDRIGSSLKNIEVSIENVGKIEIYRLEKNLNLLATIAGAAPMLGFLGTVTGMITAFMDITKIEGALTPQQLSAGIYEALITTACGLFIGILAYLGYNYLVARVLKVVHRMEYTSVEFIDLLQEPNK
ncbi:MotA/TolQ/ExbB proton channel family protein [Marinigracilibium pacificum]|uniref:MotA/TolQ/ExbB proton channel family protein n=1 Tax=Marinigracilibium pacificum TaxID=2729599 RepID=A0A848IXP4_9BACT|nr:MotA/TolQ/ExbB proton channel family protein [Marinigracilibium pacificum]NMM48406.1 MotA/TolQ/ExbB proton channel family protein [Marinigracilibium pacificum]